MFLLLKKSVPAACLAAALFVGGLSAALGACGPFTDVTDGFFCPFVLEIFYLGITTGTTPTTYDPAGTVTRLQMAAFLSRTVDGILKRGSQRAALGQFSTRKDASIFGLTTVGSLPGLIKFDGADLWAANSSSSTISRIRASDGRLLETWTGATSALGVLVAPGGVFATGGGNPGSLFRIVPSQPAGSVTTVASNLGGNPSGLAFDGSRIWTANAAGSVSIITPDSSTPWSVNTVSGGFLSPNGAIYDGSHVWVTDFVANSLLKLSSTGGIIQTVTLGAFVEFPAYDGANIWVPGFAPDLLAVVRASNGAVLGLLTGNGLNGAQSAAFDGERILVTNYSGNSVSLWKAADLTPLGSFPAVANGGPTGACSDGVNFWITLTNTDQVARF